MSGSVPDIYKVLEEISKDRVFVYNLINLLAVKNNLRPGAIISEISPSDPAKIALFMSLLQVHGITGGIYRIHSKDLYNIIMVRTSKADLVGLMAKVVEGQANYPDFHKNTGTILGYIKPLDVTKEENLRLNKWSMQFTVTVKLPNDSTMAVQHFPQRMTKAANGEEEFARYKSGLENMEMPEGYEILDVTIRSHALGGRRRTRRLPKTRRRAKRDLK
jgi:hypothetical protein